jgi:hypothetical protein
MPQALAQCRSLPDRQPARYRERTEPRIDKGGLFDIPATRGRRRNPCRTGKTIRRDWLPDRVKCGK